MDQEDQQKQGLSTLSKLLVSFGAGLNAAGGGDSTSLLNLAQKRSEQNAPISRSDREKIELQGGIDLAKESFKQAAELSKEGRLKPNDLFTKFENAIQPFSTVREGEFATAQNSAGVPERIRNLANQVVSGKRLGDDQRKDFVTRATKLFKNAELQAKKTTSQFAGLAQRNQIDPKNIIRDVGLAQAPSQTSRTTSSGNVARRIS